MKREVPLGERVYGQMYPNPQPKDPTKWDSLVRHHLVKEVRAETLAYHGEVSSVITRFPGLDYASPCHRRRLSRFSYHSKLFEAMDALRLSDFEIRELCSFEGSLAARKKYESDRGIVIDDTAGDGILHWNDPIEVARREAKAAAREAEAAANIETEGYIYDEEPNDTDMSHNTADDEQEQEDEHELNSHIATNGRHADPPSLAVEASFRAMTAHLDRAQAMRTNRQQTAHRYLASSIPRIRTTLHTSDNTLPSTSPSTPVLTNVWSRGSLGRSSSTPPAEEDDTSITSTTPSTSILSVSQAQNSINATLRSTLSMAIEALRTTENSAAEIAIYEQMLKEADEALALARRTIGRPAN